MWLWPCGEGSGSGALTTEQRIAMKDTALKGKGLGSDLLDTCDLCAAPLEPFGPCPESPGTALGGGWRQGSGPPSPPSAVELVFIFLCFIFQLQDS